MMMFLNKLGRLFSSRKSGKIIEEPIAEQKKDDLLPEPLLSSVDAVAPDSGESVGEQVTDSRIDDYTVSLSRIVKEEGLARNLAENVLKNVSQIDGLENECVLPVAQAMLDNFLTSKFQGNGGVIAELERITGVSGFLFNDIIIDHSARLNGYMNQIRATNAGSIGYIWYNVQDQRVRGNPNGSNPDVPEDENHWIREGQYFLWEPMKNPPLAPDGKPFRQPPKDGHPGQAGNGCRCFSKAIWLEEDGALLID